MRFHTGGFVEVSESCSCAFEHTLRHSGSETSSLARVSAGSSSGTNGATSYGSSTSLAMFSTMRAVLRLMAVVGSSKPRLSRGAMIASADASISCTKTTPASLWTHSATSSGFWMHSMISGMKSVRSLLVIVLATLRSASTAAAFTTGFVSHTSEPTHGMISVRQRRVCAGNLSASTPRSCARPRLHCHLPESSLRIAGRTKRTACAESVLVSASIADSPALATGLNLSESESSISARSGATKGSAALPPSVRMALSAVSAPMRPSAFVFPLSATVLLSESMASAGLLANCVTRFFEICRWGGGGVIG